MRFRKAKLYLPMRPIFKYKFSGYFLCIGGILLCVVGGYLIIDTLNFLKYADNAQAVVIEVATEKAAKGGKLYHVNVRYQLPQENLTVIARNNVNMPFSIHKVGDEVDIIYNRKDPYRIRINAFYDLWLPSLVVGLLGGACMLAGFHIIKK